jgi:hypothetical protein
MAENTPEIKAVPNTTLERITPNISKVWVVTSTYQGVTNVIDVCRDKKSVLKKYPSLGGDDRLFDADANGNGLKAVQIPIV